MTETTEDDCLAEMQRLVTENDRLAYHLANKAYTRLHPKLRTRLSREDYHQEALLALTVAARKFEPSKGKFSTWAGRIITNQLSRFPLSATVIHVPPHALYDAVKENDLEQYDLAVRALMLISADDDDLGDTLSREEVIPEDMPLSDRTKTALDKLDVPRSLKTKPSRSRAVLVRLFGLEGHPAMNMAEIALNLGMTYAAVSSAKAEGLKKMGRILVEV